MRQMRHAHSDAANHSDHDPLADLRARVAARAKAIGVQPVAKALGVSRSAVQSFVLGREHRGTTLLICTAADRLDVPTSSPRGDRD